MSNQLRNKPGKQAVQIKQQVAKFHQGPLPSPEDLAQYDAIAPGVADRIVKMAEDQAQHRYTLEHKSIDSDVDIRRRMMNERRTGQYMAFVIAVLFPCLGAFLISKGFKTEGSIFGGVGLIPVIYAFIPKKEKDGNGNHT